MTKDIEILLRWLRIREEHGTPFPTSLIQLHADIDHSALLKRLFDGKEPFDKPPPRAFSYPNYDLFERGFSEPLEVWKDGYKLAIPDEEAIVIDQYPWHLVEVLGEEDYVVKYDGNEDLYRAFRMPGVRKGYENEQDHPFAKFWRLEPYNKGT